MPKKTKRTTNKKAKTSKKSKSPSKTATRKQKQSNISKSTKVATSQKKVVVKIEKPAIFSKLSRNKSLKRILTTVLPIVLIFFAVDSFVQYLNNDYSIAVVNGKRISRDYYYKKLEQLYGTDILNSVIQEELIRQEAEIQGITVLEEEVDAKYKEIEDQTGGAEQLQAALEQYHITEEELRSQLKLQIMLDKLAEPQLTYTDDDLKAFFEQYKDTLYPDEEVTFEDKKAEIEAIYKDQQLSIIKQTILTDLQTKALIQNNLTDKPKFRVFGSIRSIIENLSNQASN